MSIPRQSTSSILPPSVFVGVCLAAVAMFSSVFLLNKSLRLDEAQSLWQTSHDVSGVLEIIAQDVHLPVYFLTVRAWETVFGATVLSIRTFSLLFLLASLPIFFALAKRAYATPVAVVTVLLVSLSPFLLWYGSEGRMYTLLLFFTLVNTYAFMSLWKPGPDWRDWCMYALTAWLGAMTHYFFLFVLLSQAVFYILRRRLFSRWSLVAFGLIAGGVLTENLLWYQYRQTVGQIKADPFLPPPTSIDVFNIFSHFFIGFQAELINTVFLSLWPIGVFVAFALLTRRQPGSPVTEYLFIAGLLPIVIAFIFSVSIRPLFLSRYLIIALPPLYILFVRCLFQFNANWRLGVIITVVLAMQTATWVEATSPNALVNEDYRAAVANIQARAQADDLVVITAPFTRYPLERYYHGRARLITFPAWDRYLELPTIPGYEQAALAAALEVWKQRYTDIYVLTSYDQGYEEPFRLYLDQNVERLEVHTFSPGLILSVYRLRYL
jgi:mannosyltransferase